MPAVPESRQGARNRRRYIPLPRPFLVPSRKRIRSRIVITIYGDPYPADESPAKRGVYLAIRGIPDAEHSAYAVIDSSGRQIASICPVPMESWESARPALSVRSAVLAAAGKLLGECDPQPTDAPSVIADYLGFYPLAGVDVEAYNKEADRWALPEAAEVAKHAQGGPA